MSKGPAYFLKKLFRFRDDMSLGFSITDVLFRKILRQNSGVKWAVHHSATVHCPENITKGVGVFPGDSPGVYINALNGLLVGDYTNIGPNVGIITANHDFVDNNLQVKSPPVVIGKYCWLGMGAVILPGVVLGDFTVVGAGAIVTRSFPEGYCVLAGNPAGIIRNLNKTACDSFVQNKK